MSGSLGTLRAPAYLLNLFRDDQADEAIVPQFMRDVIATILSFTAGIAATGTTQSGAITLTNRWTVVTTTPLNSGVILQAGLPGTVSNRGANPLSVYPPDGGQIENNPTNAPLVVAPGHDVQFVFDPVVPTQVYAIATINLANLGTTVPSVSGIPWLNSGSIEISP